MNQWIQNHNPISIAWLSTAVAAIPVAVPFYLLAVKKTVAYRAAFYGFLASVLIAGFIFGMPWAMVTGAAAGGLVFGFIRMAGAATFLTGLISGPILGLSVTVAP